MRKAFFANRANAVWLFLMAATALAWWLDAAGWLPARAGAPAVDVPAQGGGTRAAGLAVLLLAWCKGMAVILEFMELRHAPALWRRTLVGMLSFMLAVIALAYWFA